MTFLSTVIFRGHTLSLCTMKPAQGQTSESFASFSRGLVIKAKSVSSKSRSKLREVAFTKHKNAFDSLFLSWFICYQVSFSVPRLMRMSITQLVDYCKSCILIGYATRGVIVLE